jgi:hypothetical protein
MHSRCPCRPTPSSNGAEQACCASPVRASWPRQRGIDAQNLADELGAYSRAVHSGTTDALPVPRTKPNGALDAALVAFPMVPGITYTMGGPLIDGQAQVLSERGLAIPGLYAAGAAAGRPRPAATSVAWRMPSSSAGWRERRSQTDGTDPRRRQHVIARASDLASPS